MTTPTLTGSLVRLEPLTLAHLPALETFALDQNIWRYMHNWITTPEELRAYAESALELETTGTGMPWTTFSVRDNKAVGGTRFYELDLKNKRVMLGFTWLHPAYRRTGINVEAKLLQLTYAFETLGLNRVALKTHHENLASQKAMLGIGCTCEGTHRNALIMPDGSIRHDVWFSIVKEEWPQVKERLVERLKRRS